MNIMTLRSWLFGCLWLLGVSPLMAETDSILDPLGDSRRAMIQGVVEDMPIGDFLAEALPEGREVIFITPEDANLTVVFEGPMWADEAINEMLAQVGLSGIWLEDHLVVHGDHPPYIVGYTPRTQRSEKDTHFIIPPGRLQDAFAKLAGEHGRFPVVSGGIAQLELVLTKPMWFAGTDIVADLGHFGQMLKEAIPGIPFQMMSKGDFATLDIAGPSVGKPTGDAKVACYGKNHPDKNYAAIERDMRECWPDNVSVLDRLPERTKLPPLTDDKIHW